MRIRELMPTWGVALLLVITILQKVHGGECASDKQRKSGIKKLKNYKTLLRTLAMNEGADDNDTSGDKNVGSRLMKNLFNNYNKNIRPVLKPEDPVKVGFGVSIIEILGLNTENGHVKINTWLRMTWRDENLVWKPKEYGGMEEIHVPAETLWTPDIMLYNNAESENPISRDVNTVVTSSGQVTWVAPATFHITCRHEFRGNAWLCSLNFASWTFNGLQLDIIPIGDKVDIDTSEYLQSDYYSLLYHDGRRETKTYPGYDDTPYPAMIYDMRVRNKIGPSLLGK